MMNGEIFNIQRFCTHDGPGIRTVVFMKGCPLDCAWCHNPESKSFRRQIMFDEEKCINCGWCKKICKSGAHMLENNKHTFIRGNCRLCMNCTQICPTGALEKCGEIKTVEEILEVCMRDTEFYNQSGGGITLSGGEPLYQFDFLLEFLKKAKEMGYTCGAISMVVDSPISRYCDHVFNYGSHECGQDVFVCRGVPTSSLFLMLFALEAGLKKQVITLEDYDAHINQLNKVTELMIEVRQKADKWYENNKKEFYSMKRAMVCGIGPSFGVANEGALKMEETIGIPSNVYELEEFLHGPTYEIKKDNAVFLVDMDEASHDRIMTIYKAMFELTDRVYLITNSDEVSGDNVLNIHSDIAEELRTLLFVIPFQVLASRVCDDLRIRAITIFNYRSAQLLKTKTD